MNAEALERNKHLKDLIINLININKIKKKVDSSKYLSHI